MVLRVGAAQPGRFIFGSEAASGLLRQSLAPLLASGGDVEQMLASLDSTAAW